MNTQQKAEAMNHAKQATILLVDDDERNLKYLELLLSEEGYAVCTATSGEAAMAAVAERLPDLILLDIMLPGIDGFEVGRRLKADSRTGHIPIILVTALDDRESRIKGLEVGVEEFLTKPVDRAELQMRVRTLLKIKAYNDFLADHSRLLQKQVDARTTELRESEARYRRITESLTDYQYTVRIENGRAKETTQSPACVPLTGYTADEFAADPHLWIRMVAPEDRELVTEQVQHILAGHDVQPIEHRIVRKDGETRWVSNTTVMLRDATGKLLSYDGVIKDITERKKAAAALAIANKELQDSLEDTVRAIAALVEIRDPYTSGHQTRVANLAMAIAKQMGLTDDQVHSIYLAGVVHDLGKVKIPAEILGMSGKISDAEFTLIKLHPQMGFDILKGIKFPWPIAQMVLQHHERLDGSGYPEGLKREAILLEARFRGVADTVEAMASHRPYRPALGIEAALAEIERGRGTLYDPAVADACLKLFREGQFAF